jgi:uncharacterized lipoprotein NlpE involved in copper resistance
MTPLKSMTLFVMAALTALSVTAQPATEWALPATYTGVLPCADCAGIVHTLTLRPDGLYFLRQTYLGKPGNAFSQAGGWQLNASKNQITLKHGTELKLFSFDKGELLQLDRRGQRIPTRMNLTLRRTAQVDRVSDVVQWSGQFTYMADAASFTNCDTPQLRWPVAMQGDYLALERRYSQSRSEPGTPLLVTFEGHLAVLPAMEGPDREQLVVDKFVSVHPGLSCPTQVSD